MTNSHDKPEPEPDWFLIVLVRSVNASPMTSIGITLLVGGSLISGLLVGGNMFFDDIAERFGGELDARAKAEGGSEDEPGLETELREAAMTLYGRGSKPDDSEEEAPIAYLHLRDAYIYHPGGTRLPDGQGTWLRVRIDSVDAWAFGMLTVGAD
jgi:hypothetical protein